MTKVIASLVLVENECNQTVRAIDNVVSATRRLIRCGRLEQEYDRALESQADRVEVLGDVLDISLHEANRLLHADETAFSVALGGVSLETARKLIDILHKIEIFALEKCKTICDCEFCKLTGEKLFDELDMLLNYIGNSLLEYATTCDVLACKFA